MTGDLKGGEFISNTVVVYQGTSFKVLIMLLKDLHQLYIKEYNMNLDRFIITLNKDIYTLTVCFIK